MSDSLNSIPQNIVLIGFMAAGKSSVGKLLARELRWAFLDTDSEIERVTRLKIPEIFQKYGEARFRSEENLLVHKISGFTDTVIATGGGTVLNPENWNILHGLGKLVYLYVPLEIALQRAKEHHDRPLLSSSEPEQIEKLWRDREVIYRKAPITVDTSDKDVQTVAAEILELLKGEHITA
ncbi:MULTISPECIES: shikimate kinase [Dehalobacter]|uniref:Shikimate kinase n=2 Tax=Dehalobacter restrictus TaxID=55583 RepID=A0A857DIN0_9FIRM|nr:MULTISPECIES: shikimate kinase [Dehalobacter]AHF09762.1 shikimate kinase [Dehalobacter restrictus DSM 9455]MCG1025328.1 shikimate kinase [Dehalobacter sp.]OCZ52692.1 shikimate kinase [Dehalobacter sp. TeCB1]QHA00352.1 shikimate kinase [Dehalobacter restrictus]